MYNQDTYLLLVEICRFRVQCLEECWQTLIPLSHSLSHTYIHSLSVSVCLFVSHTHTHILSLSSLAYLSNRLKKYSTGILD